MIGSFIMNQVLGMKWLNQLIAALLSALGIDIESKIGGSLLFFLYDTIKIIILLCVLIYIISYIQSYFPPEKSKKTQTSHKVKRLWESFMAYGLTVWRHYLEL